VYCHGTDLDRTGVDDSLESAKPMWQGVVCDCAMVLGTNAIIEYGIQTVQADGAILQSKEGHSRE